MLSRFVVESSGIDGAFNDLEFQKIIYPYIWGEYNVLVLPPSFPYGGMENPVFTFATPSIISKVWNPVQYTNPSLFLCMCVSLTGSHIRIAKTLMSSHMNFLIAGAATLLPVLHGSISG